MCIVQCQVLIKTSFPKSNLGNKRYIIDYQPVWKVVATESQGRMLIGSLITCQHFLFIQSAQHLHNLRIGKEKAGNNSGYIVVLTPPLILGVGSYSAFCLRFSSSSLRYLFLISLMSFVIPHTLKKRMICSTPNIRSMIVKKSIIIFEQMLYVLRLVCYSY